MPASTPAIVAAVVALQTVAEGYRCGCRQSAYVQPARLPSINRLNRQKDNRIQVAQNARRAACGWSLLTFYLWWGGFHLSSTWLVRQHHKRHDRHDYPNQNISIADFF